MSEFYKLTMIGTKMYYMETEAEDPDGEMEEITMKATLDDSNDSISNAIIEGENDNHFVDTELANAEEISEEDVPEDIMEKFEDRIERFGKRILAKVRVSKDNNDDDTI